MERGSPLYIIVLRQGGKEVRRAIIEPVCVCLAEIVKGDQ